MGSVLVHISRRLNRRLLGRPLQEFARDQAVCFQIPNIASPDSAARNLDGNARENGERPSRRRDAKLNQRQMFAHCHVTTCSNRRPAGQTLQVTSARGICFDFRAKSLPHPLGKHWTWKDSEFSQRTRRILGLFVVIVVSCQLGNTLGSNWVWVYDYTKLAARETMSVWWLPVWLFIGGTTSDLVFTIRSGNTFLRICWPLVGLKQVVTNLNKTISFCKWSTKNVTACLRYCAHAQ